MAVPMPDEVSFEHAASNHLVATALNAVRRMAPEFGEHAAVVGLGLVGQFSCQLLRLSGVHVMALDRLPLRLKAADEGGAERVVNVEEEDAIEVSKGFTRGYALDGAIIAFGGDGTLNIIKLIWPDGDERIPLNKDLLTGVPKGTVYYQEAGGGGGFGDPKKRDREKVREELRNELISEETAKNIYGIEV